MTTGAKAGLAAGVFAFAGPWLLLAEGSPLYTSRGLSLTLVLWVAGLAAGGMCIPVGEGWRRLGLAIIAGVLVGCALFVLVLAVLFANADWQ